MSTSLEYRTLLECFDKLVTALKSDPASVAVHLAAKGLTPADGVTDQRTKAEQARWMASEILGKVSLVPSRYDDILNVLSEHTWLRDMVKILNSTYSELHTIACKLSSAHLENSAIAKLEILTPVFPHILHAYKRLLRFNDFRTCLSVTSAIRSTDCSLHDIYKIL